MAMALGASLGAGSIVAGASTADESSARGLEPMSTPALTGAGALALGGAASRSQAVESLVAIAPAKLYFGVNRAIVFHVGAMTVAPDERLRVVLLDATGQRVRLGSRDSVEISVASPAGGGTQPREFDLAALIPELWSTPPRGVIWVQLESVARIEPAPRGVGEVRREPGPNDPPAPAPEPTEAVRRIGAPVVLEPLRSPLRAELDERVPAAPRIAFPKPLQATINAFTGYRAYVDHRVILSTEAGDIRVRLRPDAAPNTAWNFRFLSQGGFYDDAVFHRVVPVGRIAGKGFVIQGGDPTGTGEGTPGYELPFEPSALRHDFGVLSMARDTGPDTAGAQFFIALSREETARLDGLYTAFGQIEGEESSRAVRAIASAALLPGDADRPEKPVRITRVRLEPSPALMVESASQAAPTR